MFKIDPKSAFKIYAILKSKYPQIAKDYPTESSFFYLLNSSLDEGEVLIMSSKKKKSSVKEMIQNMVCEELKNLKK